MIENHRLLILRLLITTINIEGIPAEPEFSGDPRELRGRLGNMYDLDEIIYAFLTIFLYLLKCPQSLILSALRAFCFCGKPHISRSIFLYFRYQAWLKSW